MAYIELLTNQIQTIYNKNNWFISKNTLSVFIHIHCTAGYSLPHGMKYAEKREQILNCRLRKIEMEFIGNHVRKQFLNRNRAS